MPIPSPAWGTEQHGEKEAVSIQHTMPSFFLFSSFAPTATSHVCVFVFYFLISDLNTLCILHKTFCLALCADRTSWLETRMPARFSGVLPPPAHHPSFTTYHVPSLTSLVGTFIWPAPTPHWQWICVAFLLSLSLSLCLFVAPVHSFSKTIEHDHSFLSMPAWFTYPTVAAEKTYYCSDFKHLVLYMPSLSPFSFYYTRVFPLFKRTVYPYTPSDTLSPSWCLSFSHWKETGHVASVVVGE